MECIFCSFAATGSVKEANTEGYKKLPSNAHQGSRRAKLAMHNITVNQTVSTLTDKLISV